MQARGGDDRGDGWMASRTQWTWSMSKLWKTAKEREVWRAAAVKVAESQT